MFIVIFGVQGSGKGTQGELLSERLGIPHLSTGQLLRSMAEEPTEEGALIKSKLEAGQYLTDEEMTPLLRDHLPDAVILDGYPRTLNQARILDSIRHVDKVLYVDVSEEEGTRRALSRGRSDDTEEAIRKRIQQYLAQADSVLDYYKKQGKLVTINGEQTVEEVFAEICDKLGV